MLSLQCFERYRPESQDFQTNLRYAAGLRPAWAKKKKKILEINHYNKPKDNFKNMAKYSHLRTANTKKIWKKAVNYFSCEQASLKTRQAGNEACVWSSGRAGVRATHLCRASSDFHSVLWPHTRTQNIHNSCYGLSTLSSI